MTSTTGRKDVIWQRPDTVSGYGKSRAGIPFAEDQFDLVERVLRAHGSEPRIILDLGCGDGIAAGAMIDRFPVASAVLVDFSQPMLDQVDGRMSGSKAEVATIYGDLRTRDWLPEVTSRGPFDLVISRYAIHHLPDDDKRRLYGDIYTLLVPGGWFFNIEHVKSVNEHYQSAFDQLLIDGIHRVAPDAQSRDDVVRSYRERQDRDTNILAPIEDQCDWLRSIGFADVDVVFKALELAVFAGRRS